MTKLTAVLSFASLSVLASTSALSGCIGDPLSSGDDGGDDGGAVDQCVTECRHLASSCGYDDTCETACGYIETWGCLAESHALYQCKADGADICQAPQCEEQAKASLDCTNRYCDAHPGKDGCSSGG